MGLDVCRWMVNHASLLRKDKVKQTLDVLPAANIPLPGFWRESFGTGRFWKES